GVGAAGGAGSIDVELVGEDTSLRLVAILHHQRPGLAGVNIEIAQGRVGGPRDTEDNALYGTGPVEAGASFAGAVTDKLEVAARRNDERLRDRIGAHRQVDHRALAHEPCRLVKSTLDGFAIGTG